MGVDGIGEVGDQASEGQVTGVYKGRFYSGVSGRVRSQVTRGMGKKVSSDKELMEVGRMVEGDRGGGREEGCEWRDNM